jgi:hypothetical protein
MISYSFLKYLFWSFLTNTKKKLKRGNNSPRCFVSRDLIVAVKFICIHVFSSYLLLVALIRIIQERIFLQSSAVITVTFFKYMIFSFLLCLLKFKIFRHGVVFFFLWLFIHVTTTELLFHYVISMEKWFQGRSWNCLWKKKRLNKFM